MSYNDYGGYSDEPRRASRRAAREPVGPAKVQASTAAAILVLVGIVGFGIGALIGNSGGDDTATATTENSDGTPLGSPDAQSTDPDTAGDEPTDGSTDEAGGDGGEDVAGAQGITLTSIQDGGEVTAGESGTIEVQAALDSGEDGVTINVERSLDGGQTWEAFCDACTDETSGSGTYSTNFWTGQTGENLFRVVGPDGMTSNAITVTVVEGNDEDDGDDD